MTTRARHPTHTIKNIWDAEKKNNQKPLRGRAKRHSVTRNKRGEKKEKKKEKDFSPLFVYIRGSPRDDDDYTHEEKKFGNLSRKKKL